MKQSGSYRRRFEIDTARFPVVVFESDDWGACEAVPDRESYEQYRSLLKRFGKENEWGHCGLESALELEELHDVLAARKDRDGVCAVFTAFTCMGNPDYAKIRAGGFREYFDISPGDGFPSRWHGDGVVAGMLDGVRRGVWAPEFHSVLHHTSPLLWLELLRSDSEAGKLARGLFELESYYQLEHLPEYYGYSVREQFAMIDCGFSRFERLFGRTPSVAVTSDAYPETELLWAARGVRTVALKNCRINSGEVVVYPTKPWNMQDVYAKIGDCDDKLDVACLTRNVFLETATPAAEALAAVERVWRIWGEPAVISTHRANYCSWQSGFAAERLARLETVLDELVRRGAIFLTSGELGDIYRQGWSERRVGDRILFRNWCAGAELPPEREALPPGTHWLTESGESI